MNLNDILIGEGAFSKVYKKIYGGREIAVKIANSLDKDKHIKYTKYEKEVLQNFMRSKYIINMIDLDLNNNPDTICLELVGNELQFLIDNYYENNCYIPLNIVKKFTRQILCGLAELKEKKIIHSDLKPENILLTKNLDHRLFSESKKINIRTISRILNKHDKYIKKHIRKNYHVLRELILQSIDIKISDLGTAIKVEDLRRHNQIPGTTYYRPPELILQSKCNESLDMWSLGCIVYEMLTGDILFDAKRDNNMSQNSHHLALMIQILGNIPPKCLVGKKINRYFVENQHKFRYLFTNKHSLRKLLREYDFSKKESAEIGEFLSLILEYDINKRITPNQCLQTKWLK